MTIFAGSLLAALWCVATGLLGFSIGKGGTEHKAATLAGMMMLMLFLVTIGFINHLTG